jgi:hypothetical protein
MMRSGGGLIMVLAWVNNLFIQQLVPLNVDPIAIKVNDVIKQLAVVVVVVVVEVVVVVDMLDCSVDTVEFFHAYFFNVFA